MFSGKIISYTCDPHLSLKAKHFEPIEQYFFAKWLKNESFSM
jgi:hypothetical protein